MSNQTTADWIRKQKTASNPYTSIENIKESINSSGKSSSIFGGKVVLNMLDVCTVLKLSVDLSDSMIMMTELLKICDQNGVFEQPNMVQYKQIITQIVETSNAST